MRDVKTHVENTFKDALTTAGAANGIDKSELGYLVGGHGVVAPVVTDQGISGFSPSWSFAVELRSLLLGQPALARLVMVQGVVPADDAVRMLAGKLLAEVLDDRSKQFKGEQ